METLYICFVNLKFFWSTYVQYPTLNIQLSIFEIRSQTMYYILVDLEGS